ncbi:hypothetical protein A3F02_01255 [Candidatus Curtissbacteria bacterium RIFCSPHIGHO2_12_FULL_38_9b]|uniref:Uncharacterized protein n=1 Tax=Candidatus Curtissbacteria bacterium RIFCSPHIGHO2_12_FULL_38_9b TaxID=1797720 RepID=A0A1F5GZF7_9BACT|nr:MAG: hypothetical protein A3F02_01255 [Candidatus Curtissbacteria bacterium RIFCSPHIGHO2_12_FULL_38_9b]
MSRIERSEQSLIDEKAQELSLIRQTRQLWLSLIILTGLGFVAIGSAGLIKDGLQANLDFGSQSNETPPAIDKQDFPPHGYSGLDTILIASGLGMAASGVLESRSCKSKKRETLF